MRSQRRTAHGIILSGISLICFAASYAVAWLLEVAQLFRRSRAGGC